MVLSTLIKLLQENKGVKEKIKIGANSATDIKDTANGSPCVFSIMKRSTAKFLTHIPICKNNPEIIIA